MSDNNSSRIARACAIVPIVAPLIVLVRFWPSSSDSVGLLSFVVVLAAGLNYAGWFIIAFPIFLLLQRTPLYHPVPITLAGGIGGYLVVPIGQIALGWRALPEETAWMTAIGLLEAILFVWLARVPFRREAKLPVRDEAISK